MPFGRPRDVDAVRADPRFAEFRCTSGTSCTPRGRAAQRAEGGRVTTIDQTRRRLADPRPARLSDDKARAERVAAERRHRRAALLNLAIRLVSLAIALALWQVVGAEHRSGPVHDAVEGRRRRRRHDRERRAVDLSVAEPGGARDRALARGRLRHRRIGLLLARFWVLDVALSVYITFLYSIPSVALVPLIVLWAGFEITAKVIILFLFAFFPMVINTYQGVKSGRSEAARGRPRVPLLGTPVVDEHRAAGGAAVHRHRPAARARPRPDRHGARRSLYRDLRHRLPDRAHRLDLSRSTRCSCRS